MRFSLVVQGSAWCGTMVHTTDHGASNKATKQYNPAFRVYHTPHQDRLACCFEVESTCSCAFEVLGTTLPWHIMRDHP